MSDFDLDHQEVMANLGIPLDKPNAAPKPTMFERGWAEAGKGIMLGQAKLGRLSMQAGAAPMVIADALIGNDSGSADSFTGRYFEDVAPVVNNAIDYWKPDTLTSGHGAQVLNGLTSMIAPLFIGKGNPSLLVASEQMNTTTDAVDNGVSVGAAIDMGATMGATVAVGSVLPFLGGTLAQKMATGAVGNTALGVASTAAMNQRAKADGATEYAKQFDPFDPTGRTVDVLMGLAFGGIAHMTTPRLTPSDVDTILTHSADELASRTPNGRATDEQERQNAREIQDIIAGQMAAGEPLHVSQPPTRPTLSGHAATIAQAAEATGVDPTTAVIISHIETGGRFNADAQNPSSSANGLFQVINDSWTRLGGGDRSSVSEQIRVGLLHMQEVSKTLRAKLGREPATHEQYMGHLLGSGGAGVVLRADPNARLYDVVLGYANGKTKAAREKFARDTVNNNGMKGLTVGEAIAKWQAKTDALATKYGKAGDARSVDGTPVVDAAPPDVTTIQDPSMVFLDELFGDATPARSEPAAPMDTAPPAARADVTAAIEAQVTSDAAPRPNPMPTDAPSQPIADNGRVVLTEQSPTISFSPDGQPARPQPVDQAAPVRNATPTDAPLAATPNAEPRAAVDLAAQAIDQGRPVVLRDPAVIRSAETLPEYNLRRNADGTAEIIGARQSDGTWSGTPKPDAPTPNTRTNQPQPTPDAQPATGADSAGSTPTSNNMSERTTGVSDIAALRQLEQGLPPDYMVDIDGEMMPVSEAISRLEKEAVDAEKLSTAFEAAAACVLRLGV